MPNSELNNQENIKHTGSDVIKPEVIKSNASASDINNTSLKSEYVNKLSRLKENGIKDATKTWWLSLGLKSKAYIILVIMPTLLYLFYNLVIASPMYISEAKFAVRNISTSTGGVDFATQLFNVPTTSSQEAKIVEDYLKSPDILFAIDKDTHALSHYKNSDFDIISRLDSNPTLDDIVSFWHSVSLVKVNKDSNVITFQAKAYDSNMANEIVSNALAQCEKLINSMNERAREDALALAQREVDASKLNFDNAQNALKEFRNEHKDLDLKTTAEGIQTLIIELEGQATAIRTQISESLAYMHEDAPAIKALRSKLLGVEKQLEIERQKVTALSASGQSINTLAGLYESLTIDVEFARKQLEFAMASLEKAKIDIMSQNLYVVEIAKPSLPDESLYPKPFLFALYLFIALNLTLAIVSVITAAIKEHLGYQ